MRHPLLQFSILCHVYTRLHTAADPVRLKRAKAYPRQRHGDLEIVGRNADQKRDQLQALETVSLFRTAFRSHVGGPWDLEEQTAF